MNQNKIGKFIAEKRKAKGLTQNDLAEKLGVGDKAVSKWERGISLPDVSKYKELCSILDITLNEFFAGEELSEEQVYNYAEKNLYTLSEEEKAKRKILKKVIFVLAFIVILSICTIISLLNIKIEKDNNRLGQLVYNITKSDERYSHYDGDGEPMVGVTIDKNNKQFVTVKSYFNYDSMTRIRISMSYLLDENEFIQLNLDEMIAQRVLSREEMVDLGVGDGIKKITIGEMTSGGAGALISTNCGQYMIEVKSLYLNNEDCIDELMFFMSAIDTDKSLEVEEWGRYQ